MWALLATLGAANLGYFFFIAPKESIGGTESAKWVHGYVGAHLSSEEWKVLGVKPTKIPTMEIRMMMTGRQNLKSIKSMGPERRAIFLKEVCPPPQVARVRWLLDKGWRIRIIITGPNGKLTEGWCLY